MGWADGLADGLSSGIQLGNSIQRNQAAKQEQEWKAEDRQRETEERKQLDELGKVMTAVEKGDLSPAVASANSSGQFGPDRFAAGARVGEDGFVYANVYNNKDPINSMEEVKLGKLPDIKNQVFMAHAPSIVVAKLALAQAQKQSDPAYQQQMALGAETLKQKQFESANQPIKFNTDQSQAKATLAHTNASTDNLTATAKQQALMSPEQLRKAKADADEAEFKNKNPYWNRAVRTEVVDEFGDRKIITREYGDGGQQQQQSALAGPAPGAAPAQQPTAPAQPAQPAAPAAKTAAPQQQQKKILNSDTIKQYLLKAGGDTKKARAMAESDGWSF